MDSANTVAATDDHGDSIGTATVIAPDSSTAGTLDPAGDNDYFRIDVPESGVLQLYTTGSTNTDGFLLDSSGSELAKDGDSGTDGNFRIEQFLAAGTYYVRVRYFFALGGGPYTLVSAFTPGAPSYTLTVSTAGNGTVTSSPAGIDCGSTCAADFTDGTSVTLTATPASGYAFYGWSGACSGSATTCEMAVDSAKAVTATFAAVIDPDSSTAGTIEPMGDNDYFRIDVVQSGVLQLNTIGSTNTYGRLLDSSGSELAADDNSGTDFNFRIQQLVTPGTYYVRVSGGFFGSGPYTLVSAFAPDASLSYTLTVDKAGSGTVTSVPAGINCGSTCAADFTDGTDVTLSATAASGFEFSGWSGACSGTAATCLVTMDGAKAATATFTADDDHGNSTATATVVDPDSSTAGTIDPIDDNDYFRIEVPQSGTLELYTIGTTNTYGRLLDSSGSELAVDDDSGSDFNFRIEQSVTAGTYYVRVSGGFFGAGPYTLIASFLPDGITDCSTTALVVDAETITTDRTYRSEIGVTMGGDVHVAAGTTRLQAPQLRFEPGFRVAAGATLAATTGPVTCGTAASATAAVVADADIAPLAASASLPAAELITAAAALPDWLQHQLVDLGVALDAIAAALLGPDGRWLIIETTQALVMLDANAGSDVYYLDLFTDRLALVSATEQGQAANGPSRAASADASGELIVFQSEADDLVPNDANGVSDIFLHDRVLGETTRLTDADQAAANPALDAAGQDLLYDQRGAEGQRQVLLGGLWDGAPAEAVGLTEDGDGRLLDNHHPAISADGRFVAYLEATADALEPTCQVHVYDRDSALFERSPCPEALAAEREVARPAFTPDGAQVQWFLPGIAEPVVVPNPLHDTPMRAEE